MEKLDKNTNKYLKKDLEDELKKDYIIKLKDKKFLSLVNKFKLKEEVGMRYTSKLEHVIDNLNNCEKCKGLVECKNDITGCVYYPKKTDEGLDFNYVTCKYKNKELEEQKKNKSITIGLSDELKNAKLANVDVKDLKRKEVIKWITNFEENYPKTNKGLYLHGSFGSGKTFLISALLNELAKKDYKVIMIYYPELLNKLKSTFDSEDNSFDELFSDIKSCDILLLDDIGAEVVTNWSRDEILGTLLQYRMEHNLTTFFTSNLTIEELELNLSIVKNSVDKVKARRIIERIKQLTTDMELISKNRRN